MANEDASAAGRGSPRAMTRKIASQAESVVKKEDDDAIQEITSRLSSLVIATGPDKLLELDLIIASLSKLYIQNAPAIGDVFIAKTQLLRQFIALSEHKIRPPPAPVAPRPLPQVAVPRPPTQPSVPAKAFLRYIGGKQALVKTIAAFYPKNYSRYVEPFCGAGSIFFNIYSNDKNYLISDINVPLMETYMLLKSSPDELIAELKDAKRYANTKTRYDANRDEYNKIKDAEKSILKSALFIYLNRTCFNGIYRENHQGKFNIAYGKLKCQSIVDTDLLLAVSKVLSGVEIKHLDFRNIEYASGDFVYFDPPYDGRFSDYTKGGFGEKDHRELKLLVDKLTDMGVKVMISNAPTGFIKELYREYIITDIDSKCKSAGGSKPAMEVLIRNWD